ncbi:DNA polymerase/3'-5' exonuclease PolX [candidate division KSB1 bacterium]|nr:DNA polymerase/3'-5' exonuclease PolX [candidate division KSB1 bacterium]NIR73142.1 DNA polymerase/3'-5' exonuclease PolX [candidate division KSB1 bacterium]NIS23845.1 DNA polymerase/3'-5' exonuclease PolX [candidate division KSB1 bacterium]NIT70766.1 DNA polymerase/3'-5' exonuclease PolX [candidate division KSB1 bacterium]NIU24494.1 DNA polymerase/3'-5' exonuclease PolX [candidate division KSB1 bacterium]
MDKTQVAAIFEEIAVLLEIKGENPFKSRAYERAARTILSRSTDIKELVETGKIHEIKGIGTALAEKIGELVATGRLTYYDKLKASIPGSLLEMTAIPGFGPKKIKMVYEVLGIRTIGELEVACKENRLADLAGFGAKTQERILRGIEFIKKGKERFLYHHAEEAAKPLFEALSNHPKVIRAEVCGSLRRKKETVKDIDIIASTREEDVPQIMEFFTTRPEVDTITARGSTKSSVVLKRGINADLRIMPDDKFATILHHFTGSAEHNTAMRGLAKKLKLKISEYGLFRNDDELIPCKEEADMFAALGLAYIPPELREDNDEIEAAAENRIPNLVEGSDIQGILHCHSTFSDGANTIEEMAVATKELGYEYFGLCDHSQIVVYARGLTPEQVKEQHARVDELNQKFDGFKILKGTECDILNDGTLDYADDVLNSFDFVVASVHTNLNMSPEDATNRILKAMQNPYVNILGHPTGRILMGRQGLLLDMHRIIDAAAEFNVAIELNASPYRLDIDWRYCKYAKERDVLISINPDAHSVSGLQDMRYGVGIARKGWLEKENILNAMSLEKIESYFKMKRNKM